MSNPCFAGTAPLFISPKRTLVSLHAHDSIKGGLLSVYIDLGGM